MTNISHEQTAINHNGTDTPVSKQEIISQILVLITALTESENRSDNRSDTPPVPGKVELLTIKECIELIPHISDYTLRLLVKQGKIRHTRVGAGVRSKILINKTDLLSYFGAA